MAAWLLLSKIITLSENNFNHFKSDGAPIPQLILLIISRFNLSIIKL